MWLVRLISSSTESCISLSSCHKFSLCITNSQQSASSFAVFTFTGCDSVRQTAVRYLMSHMSLFILVSIHLRHITILAVVVSCTETAEEEEDEGQTERRPQDEHSHIVDNPEHVVLYLCGRTLLYPPPDVLHGAFSQILNIKITHNSSACP